MVMDPVDAKKYPKCEQFISKIDYHLKHEPDLLRAFIDTCKDEFQPQPAAIVEKIAREQALRYGAGPRIKVIQGLVSTFSRDDVIACGWNNAIDNALKKDAVFIEMTSFWFDALEFGYDPLRAGNRLKRTLLHELVHWVRDLTGASDTIQVGGYVKGEAVECGKVFEERAYGSRNICTDDEIFDALTSFRKRPS